MKKSQRGFTIIEVALVLAVGALIFLVVFLAVPSLQRNQRNDARRRDQSSVQEAITSWTSSNPRKNLTKDTLGEHPYTGGVPADQAANPLAKYIGTLSNNTEEVVVSGDDTNPGTNYGQGTGVTKEDRLKTVYVLTGQTCNNDPNATVPYTSGSKKQAAVIIYSEVANGEGDPICSAAN